MATRKRNHTKTTLTPRTRSYVYCSHRPGKLYPDRIPRTLFDTIPWTRTRDHLVQDVSVDDTHALEGCKRDTGHIYCADFSPEASDFDLFDCAAMRSPPQHIDASPSARRTLRARNINETLRSDGKSQLPLMGTHSSGGHLRRSAGLFNLEAASAGPDEFSMQPPPAKSLPLKRPHPFDTHQREDISKARLLPTASPAATRRGHDASATRSLSSPTPTPINPTRTRPFGSLPLGRGKGGVGSFSAGPPASYLTPDNSYRGVKPLQTAFLSSGLLSKRDLPPQSSPTKAPPETPRKKMPAYNTSAGSGLRFNSSNRSLFGQQRRTSTHYESDHTTESLPDSIRRFSLGPEAPSTPTPIEPMFTSTPAPARRQMSDASTITPGFASRVWNPPAGVAGRRASATDPSRFEDSLDLSTSFEDEFDFENEHSLTSSDLGSPRTPDIVHDEEPALVGSSSMESTNSQPPRSRRQPLALRVSKNLFGDSTATLLPGRADEVPPPLPGMPSLPAVSDVPPPIPVAAKTPLRANTSVGSESCNGSLADPRLGDESLMERFDRVSLLGEGEFSVVYLATPPGDPTLKLAIKRTKKPLCGARTRANRIEEVRILERLSSPASENEEDAENVIQMLDWWESDRHLYIMTEWCENGNLDAFLSMSGRVGRLDEWRVWKILSELAHGLRYIHAHDVLHLDLKPANIFVTFTGVLKIGDFGMATPWPAPKDMEREGDREYIAPEILAERLYSKPADIFSLGLMMVEIAANIVLPDNGVHWHKLRSGDLSDAGRLSSGDLQAKNGEEAPQPPSWAPYFMTNGSRALDKIVMTMLRPDPARRPRALDILALPEVRLVDERRGAGAIVWEGDFGPQPGVEGEASRVR